MNLHTLNSLSDLEAAEVFTQCCAANRWVKAMVAQRPYKDMSFLLNNAKRYWEMMVEEDFLEAFKAHPQIGDVSTLREKFANTKALASGEQSLVNEAPDLVLQKLANGNKDYLERFGFIFIVFATGKTAIEMLDLLNQRLQNSRSEEIENAAREQFKITELRLKNKLEE